MKVVDLEDIKKENLGREDKRKFVSNINSLIKQSFGMKFSGNKFLEIAEVGCYKYKNDEYRLGYIVQEKSTFFGLIQDPKRIAGKFTSDDGSKMMVLPKYLSNAKRYAELYEQNSLDREVEIEVAGKVIDIIQSDPKIK